MRQFLSRALALCGCLGAFAAEPATAAATWLFKPSGLGFPHTALTETNKLTARLVNHTGTPIPIDPAAILIDGPGAAAFGQTNDCPASLDPGQECRFTVVFKPNSAGGNTAALTVPAAGSGLPAATLDLVGNRFPHVLNDTGLRTCANDTLSQLACPVQGFPGQDAETGRDALRKTNTDANGKSGFNFTKLDANGQPLPAKATQWSCVRDNMTGLFWEAKPVGDGKVGTQGLHDADDVYNWYSTDKTNNGGGKGNPGKRRAACYGFDAANPAAWCNTEAYVDRVNAEGWCGFQDWRLPDRRELVGLLDLSGIYAGVGAIDPDYFRDNRWFSYWTASPHASGPAWAWSVNFMDGSSYSRYRTDRLAVRLVRGGR